MSVCPVNPRWAAVSVACLVLMVITVLLGDWFGTGLAMLGAVLTGYQAYLPPQDGDGDPPGGGGVGLRDSSRPRPSDRP